MPGFTEKSREYLRLAAESDKRASETKTPELHALLLELACEYLDLAEYIDDPEQWRAKLFASATAETSRDSS
jgi:hypothetical protein